MLQKEYWSDELPYHRANQQFSAHEQLLNEALGHLPKPCNLHTKLLNKNNTKKNYNFF